MFQSRFDVSSTSRYFYVVKDSKGTSCTLYDVCHGFFLCNMCITKHLDLFKVICHVLSQSQSSAIPFWRLAQSRAFLITGYRRHSSAKRRSCESMLFSLSFMKIRNSRSPSTVPCWKPEVTWTWLDVAPSSTICWVPEVRKDSIHFRIFSLISNWFSFSNSL